MTQALIGVALVALGLAPRLWLVRLLRRAGHPTGPAWRRLYWSPMAWIGLLMLIGPVSPLASGVVMTALMVAVTVRLVAGLVRGVWRFPTAVRLIGDPEAWRGDRSPYWEARRSR